MSELKKTNYNQRKIDHTRIKYYIQETIKEYKNTPIVIANQKSLLQIFAIFSSLLTLCIADTSQSKETKAGVISVAALSAFAILRAQRQTAEAGIHVFADAEEKFVRTEILNSNAKTLTFLETPCYRNREKSLKLFNKNINKINMLTTFSIATLSGFLCTKSLSTGYFLGCTTLTFTGGNILRLLNANNTRKKIQSALPKNVNLSDLISKRMR